MAVTAWTASPAVSAATISFRRAAAAMWKTPASACYAVLLFISDVTMALLPSGAQSAVAHAVSTNITHLALDPLLVLPASAFVDFGNVWIWAPLTLVLLAGIERRLGSLRALLACFGAHIVATLVSEVLLLVQIAWRLQPRSAVNIIDVGPSYVLLAALTGCLVIGSWRLRATALIVGGLIVPGLMTRLPELDMSSVGHLFALVTGAFFTGYLASGRSRERAIMLREAANKAAAATRRLGEAHTPTPVRA